MSWSPYSWRGFPIAQQPCYEDTNALDRAIETVTQLPPLVHPGEVDSLRELLGDCAAGSRFLLQGGDCAERFVDCTAKPIENKLKILLQMSAVLTWGARVPVVRIARIAGQYAKPRSSDTELFEGRSIPTYRGDHVNGHDPTMRAPDPGRLVDAYFRSAATLNYIRALLDGGFADLRHPEHWDLEFVHSTTRRAEYETLLERMIDALHFMEAAGIQDDATLRTVRLYSSHEGLLLPYEAAQTTRVGDRWYNLGAHFLWIGDRTRQLDGAHIEYFRGIANPIGLKVGPSMAPDELVRVCDVLDPEREPGRLTLITRFGSDRVADHLPSLIERLAQAEHRVVWCSDPMHGNTVKTSNGFKTRDVSRVMSELSQAFEVHRDAGGRLSGVHFELTGEDVTECIGGPQNLTEQDLERSYETYCDPRLNYGQALEMAFRIAQRLERERHQP